MSFFYTLAQEKREIELMGLDLGLYFILAETMQIVSSVLFQLQTAPYSEGTRHQGLFQSTISLILVVSTLHLPNHRRV